VDLVIEKSGRLIPVEVKMGISPRSTSSLEQFMKDFAVKKGNIVNKGGEDRTELKKGIWMLSLGSFLKGLGISKF